jgi:phosphoglycerate dehydrogenase-like enzyme
MIIAIPDDYHGVVSTLDCFRLLAGHDVRIYREAAAPFEVIPLLGLENALCTPHSAWLEKSTYELYFGEAFENATTWAAGRHIKLVDPGVLKVRHEA